MLVTCARNVAVESIASKLEQKGKWRLCVFGQADRVGRSARKYLFSEQIGRCFDLPKLKEVVEDVEQLRRTITYAIDEREDALKGCKREGMLLRFLRRRYSFVYECQNLCTVLIRYCRAALDSHEWCATRLDISKCRVIGRAKVILCTIASTSAQHVL